MRGVRRRDLVRESVALLMSALVAFACAASALTVQGHAAPAACDVAFYQQVGNSWRRIAVAREVPVGTALASAYALTGATTPRSKAAPGYEDVFAGWASWSGARSANILAVSADCVSSSGELSVYAVFRKVKIAPTGDRSVGGLRYRLFAGGEATCLGSVGAVPRVLKIPTRIAVEGFTYRVTAVAPAAFRGASSLRRVTISSNVRSLGKNAFRSCKNLAVLHGGAQLSSLGAGAFRGCRTLGSYRCDSRRLVEVGSRCFQACGGLQSVVIKSPLLGSLGKDAFKGCGNLVRFKYSSKRLGASQLRRARVME